MPGKLQRLSLRGFKTINVVRRREQVEELTKLGGDAVICTEDESVPTRVRALTAGRGVLYALEPAKGKVYRIV